MTQGPEDTNAWKMQQPKETDTPGRTHCRVCKEKIVLSHCTEAGCPWCRACGEANQAAGRALG